MNRPGKHIDADLSAPNSRDVALAVNEKHAVADAASHAKLFLS